MLHVSTTFSSSECSATCCILGVSVTNGEKDEVEGITLPYLEQTIPMVTFINKIIFFINIQNETFQLVTNIQVVR